MFLQFERNKLETRPLEHLQYCKWSREVFEINRQAGLDAVHVTVVYHEDYDEFLERLKEWDGKQY